MRRTVQHLKISGIIHAQNNNNNNNNIIIIIITIIFIITMDRQMDGQEKSEKYNK